jgi:nitric oxide reductase subunit B
MNTTPHFVGNRCPQDRTSRVLIWVFIVVTALCWAGMMIATRATYQQAAPLPQQMVAPNGTPVMSYADIVAGKSGFQQADLMDYGSLYGMGSYYGEDFTAKYLVELAKEVRNNPALSRYGKSFDAVTADQQANVTRAMQAQLQGIDLSEQQVVLPESVAQAIQVLRPRISATLLSDNFAQGYTGARALDASSATQTASFLLYSSLTSAAARSMRRSSATTSMAPSSH